MTNLSELEQHEAGFSPATPCWAAERLANDLCDGLDLLDAMQHKRLPPELDQDVRDLVRIIQEHGFDYVNTEHGDMTLPLLQSLNRLVQLLPNA